MKQPFTLLCMIVFAGCAAPQKQQAEVGRKTALVASDVDLVHHFLDALYRPSRTSYRIIADASADQALNSPASEANRDLAKRLSQLRQAPSPVIRINLSSGDRPEPWGADPFIYSYDTRAGRFLAEEPYEIGDTSLDMWVDVRHWPGGTRLVSLSFTWIDDLKDNTFHLRKGEQIFRFAVAIEPLID